MHEAIGLRGSQFDHEAVRLDLGDHGLEGALVLALDLALKEFEELNLHGVAFGFGAVALGDGDVLAGAHELADTRRTRGVLGGRGHALLGDIGVEDAVLEQVSVAANRRREVRVVALSQAEVAVGRSAVAGLLKGAE